ncbi:hypothetical protein JCM10450v2_005992 [Rhodotorula kratochvilovae]
MPPADKSPMPSTSSARDAASPYPMPASGAPGAEEDVGDEDGSGALSDGARARSRSSSVRHLSCENCRVRKMKCSRQSPCLSCRMRGDKCVWIGQAPNGSADEDELERSQNEVNRLKKLVDLLLARLEEQDEAEQQLAFYQQAHQAQQQQHDAQQQAHRLQHNTHGGDLVLVDGANGAGGYAQHSPGQAPPPQRAYTVVLPGAGSPQSEPRSQGGGAPSLHALAPTAPSHAGDIPITPLHALPPPGHFARHSPAGYASVQYAVAAGPPGDAHFSFAPPASAAGSVYAAASQSGGAVPYGARVVYGGPPGDVWRTG